MSDATVLLFVLLAGCLVVVIRRLLEARRKSDELHKQHLQLQGQKSACEDALRKADALIHSLKIENTSLARWKGVEDVDAKAAELIRAAQDVMSKASSDAAELTATTKKQADDLLDTTRRETKGMKEQARAALETATAKAAEIVSWAEKKAQEIAGTPTTP
jgi:ElaB/YqjD/DUF883 family membrane-anchored ribosome-binding protein